MTMKMEDVFIIAGLVGIQFVYAGNSIVLSHLMSIGLSPFTIVIFPTFATFLIVSPFALYYERNIWPNKFTLKLFIQLLFIAFGGVTLFQSLILKGIDLTSPAMATAMPNLAPALIFLIAWTLRIERVKLSCVYSKVKLAGTLVCVAGALTMSIMHSAAPTSRSAIDNPKTDVLLPSSALYYASNHNVGGRKLSNLFDKDKMMGCLYLLSAVFVLSTNVVLQAATLRGFPAPMSICAATSLMGVVLTGAVQLLQEHRFETDCPLLTVPQFIAYSLLGGAVTGMCVSFNGWAMKKRGPVLVSMFSPIGTLCSLLLSLFLLRQTVNIGSVAGMFIMFAGLYFVLWAKGKERYVMDDTTDAFAVASEFEFDAEKPLLS